MNSGEIEFFLYLVLIMPLLIFVFLAVYIRKIKPFNESRRYIKLELSRSFDDSEKRYWKRKLKRLYISNITLFGRLLIKFFDN